MRPIPVPDDVASLPWVEGSGSPQLAHFSFPTTVAPVEAVYWHADDGELVAGVVVEMDEEEAAKIVQDGARRILLAWPGGVPVFMEPQIL